MDTSLCHSLTSWIFIIPIFLKTTFSEFKLVLNFVPKIVNKCFIHFIIFIRVMIMRAPNYCYLSFFPIKNTIKLAYIVMASSASDSGSEVVSQVIKWAKWWAEKEWLFWWTDAMAKWSTWGNFHWRSQIFSDQSNELIQGISLIYFRKNF